MILFFSLGRAGLASENAAEVELESYLDRDRARIGDPVTCYLRVRAAEGVTADFGEPWTGEGEAVEVRGTGGGESSLDGQRLWERWYLLKCFETGQHALPPAAASLKFPDGREEALAASPLLITVSSVLDSSPQSEDIRDIKAPRGLKVSYLLPILVAAAALALVAASIIIVRRLRRPREAPAAPPPPRPPHEIAYEELKRIRGENLPALGRIKEYYSRVSDVTRRYLENRFGLHSPERTTEEFLVEMATSGILTVGHQELVGEFLRHCDLVKFARYGPTAREIEGVYDSAVKLVDETKASNLKSEI